MALTEKELVNQWIPEVRFADGSNVNLMNVREAIQNEAVENGIPVAFKEDQIKIKNGTRTEIEDVLVMFNPDHEKEYYNFIIRVQHMGKYAFLYVYVKGISKNKMKQGALLGALGGLAMSGSVLGIATSVVGGKMLGKGQRLNAEEQYYAILQDVLKNVAGIG